jgi:hypothetical protein
METQVVLSSEEVEKFINQLMDTYADKWKKTPTSYKVTRCVAVFTALIVFFKLIY